MYQHGNHLVRLLEAAGGTVEFLSKTASSIPAGMLFSLELSCDMIGDITC
ncbi:hypothetical protein KC19_VG139400 [Ceratodon purpureus]|uniref:Uncharacterized protein n=1 Tax=Ceratodon purpureus TaxID=3225 RepID=A0A8T0HR09_CERPU|nr:hypothetical protein KC19_VG139400 [Ceratodon purpureus]